MLYRKLFSWNRDRLKIKRVLTNFLMKRTSSGALLANKQELMSRDKRIDAHNARPYQVEILQKSIKENTIVCLGTGTGKTFISVMLIREKSFEINGTVCNGGKRTFFIVNTVPLAEQQYNAIKDHTNLSVKFFTGDMGVDFWDRDRWVKEFNENEVLVMTAQILENILNSAFITVANINLLIMDECHNATKSHVYVRIMQLLRDAQKYDNLELPHIMGLTASIINEKYKKVSTDFLSIKHFLNMKMKELECTMRSKCVTCSDVDSVASFATKPLETVMSYACGYDVNEFVEMERMINEVKKRLYDSADKFNMRKKKSKIEEAASSSLSSSSPSCLYLSRRYGDMETFMNRNFTFGTKDVCSIAADALKYCSHILETLGPLCAYEAACILKDQLNNNARRLTSDDRTMLNECIEMFDELMSSYVTCVQNGPFKLINNVIPVEPFITKKAQTFLSDVLLQQKYEFKKDFNKELHAIVFVQRRCTAVILSKLINLAADKDPAYKGLDSNYVLGHGLSENIRLADSLMRSSQQSTILRDFKQSKFNVLVSTSVVEEGLDVRKCNLVVRFDGITNYREYAQSKGRARDLNSRFIVMAIKSEEQEMKRQLEVMQNIERVLFENCQARDLPSNEDIEQQMQDEIEQFIPTIRSGHARIPHHSSIALLHRFCSYLPHDKYTRSAPIFVTHRRSYANDECQAECKLPHNFPIEPRIWKGEWIPSVGGEKAESLAKKQLATTICQKLLEHGELTEENLLPVKHKDLLFEEDYGDKKKTIEGTRKNRDFYFRKIPKILSGNVRFEDWQLYAISIVLSHPYRKSSMWPLWFADQKESFGIFLPNELPQNLPTIRLYTKLGDFAVSFVKLASNNKGMNTDIVQAYHAALCQQIFEPHVYGEFCFDDNCDEISKGYIVPLKKCVFKNISLGLNTGTGPVDLNGIEEFLSLLSSAEFPAVSTKQQDVIRKNYLHDGHPQGNKLYYVIGPTGNKASDIMDEKKTFVQYYQERYERTINPDAELLDVVAASSSAVSFMENLDWENNRKETCSNYRIEQLVPELCVVAHALSAQQHMQSRFLPYIFYKLEVLLSSRELQERLASDLDDCLLDDPTPMATPAVFEETSIGTNAGEMDKMSRLLRVNQNSEFSSPTWFGVSEAITTRQAKFDVNLERLEMLGDAFLKQAVSVFLFFKHPLMNEGKLTMLRMNLISNKNLCSVAKQFDMQHYIANSSFGVNDKHAENKNPVTVWLPPNHHRGLLPEKDSDMLNVDEDVQWRGFQEIQDKSLADTIEALIGVYLKTGGVNLALRFMSVVCKIPCLHADIDHKGLCHVQCGTSSNYGDFPLASSAVLNEFATYDDVIELYGKGKFSKLEKTLGYVFDDKSHIVRAMTHSSYEENQVTRAYEEYEYLGDAILDFLITLHVYANERDLTPGELTSIKSALVNNNVFSLYTTKFHLHKFMFHLSKDLFDDCAQFARIVEEGCEESGVAMEELFESPFIVTPPGSEEGFIAPKVMGDLIESLAGAIFLDSGLDLITVWKVFYPIMQPIIDKYMANVPLSPKRMIHENFTDARFEFTEENESNPNESVTCTLHYGNGKTMTGIGKKKKIAKIMASYRALKKEGKL